MIMMISGIYLAVEVHEKILFFMDSITSFQNDVYISCVILDLIQDPFFYTHTMDTAVKPRYDKEGVVDHVVKPRYDNVVGVVLHLGGSVLHYYIGTTQKIVTPRLDRGVH